MYKNLKILAIIPARGGSKGIPYKNIKLLSGKPLISWTIKEAIGSKYIDKVIVNTDSFKIAEIAKRYKAQVPFLRPKKLGTDKASSIDVILHTIQWFQKRMHVFDIIILLQPTSPLRGRCDIDAAIEALFKKKAKAIVSVTEAGCSPLLMNILPKDGNMKDFIDKKIMNSGRQDLPGYYQLNGAIFIGFSSYIIKNKGFYGDRTFAYIMPRERSVDIDDIVDFKLAGALLGRVVRNKKK
jgi:N-acylneuraminate cytidylyltransferase/CMP-N,N'-diacetyllegionaminic acid synthase